MERFQSFDRHRTPLPMAAVVLLPWLDMNREKGACTTGQRAALAVDLLKASVEAPSEPVSYPVSRAAMLLRLYCPKAARMRFRHLLQASGLKALPGPRRTVSVRVGQAITFAAAANKAEWLAYIRPLFEWIPRSDDPQRWTGFCVLVYIWSLTALQPTHGIDIWRGDLCEFTHLGYECLDRGLHYLQQHGIVTFEHIGPGRQLLRIQVRTASKQEV